MPRVTCERNKEEAEQTPPPKKKRRKVIEDTSEGEKGDESSFEFDESNTANGENTIVVDASGTADPIPQPSKAPMSPRQLLANARQQAKKILPAGKSALKKHALANKENARAANTNTFEDWKLGTFKEKGYITLKDDSSKFRHVLYR